MMVWVMVVHDGRICMMMVMLVHDSASDGKFETFPLPFQRLLWLRILLCYLDLLFIAYLYPVSYLIREFPDLAKTIKFSADIFKHSFSSDKLALRLLGSLIYVCGRSYLSNNASSALRSPGLFCSISSFVTQT